MKNLAFLSCDSLDEYIVDDDLLVSELSGEFEVETVSWSRKCEWAKFDAVIIRTTWDYMKRPEEFLDTLMHIQISGVKLFNSFSVISWNIHKFYLKELQDSGIFIVPTLFIKDGQKISIPPEWASEKIVVKPAISAGAYQTTVLSKDEIGKRTLQGDWLVQPFLKEIARGEISLIFFDKKFSHGLIKIPKSGEFRVQQEFGGTVTPYVPDEELLKLALNIVGHIDLPLLYARVDLVPLNGSYALMELELIEPALYFNTSLEAARNFKVALRNYL